MKVRFSFLTAGILLIGAPLGLLCFNRFPASLAQDASQEKKLWKVFKSSTNAYEHQSTRTR